MRQIAPDVVQLALTPRDGINAYLIDDVLVDTGASATTKRLLEAIDGRPVRAIALTHAHGDHAGAARRLASERDLPVWVGSADRAATEAGRAVKKSPFQRPGLSLVAGLLGDFAGVPVARELSEGDELAAGFTVLETPGHSPGHVSFWREHDRVLICGDVFFNMHLLTTLPGLRQPPGPFTVDPARNRLSERRVAALQPSVAGFGHGPVINNDASAQLNEFVGTLSD